MISLLIRFDIVHATDIKGQMLLLYCVILEGQIRHLK